MAVQISFCQKLLSPRSHVELRAGRAAQHRRDEVHRGLREGDVLEHGLGGAALVQGGARARQHGAPAGGHG